MNPHHETGSRARAFRELIKLKQDEVAEATGQTIKTISFIENGHRKPNQEYIQAMVSKFRLNTQWLFTGEGQPQMSKTVQAKSIEERVINLESKLSQIEGMLLEALRSKDNTPS